MDYPKSAQHLPACPSSQHCSEWARTYLEYCLCNTKDGVALFLGTFSILSWAISEVPQIITNYREKSTEGLSFAFLMTWIIGDLFNLIGCQLEPATLPTQYYVALLYTATTLVLGGQSIYYSHIYQKFKANKCLAFIKIPKFRQENKLANESLLDDTKGSGDDQENGVSSSNNSSPIPVSQLVLHDSFVQNYYYMSARFLKNSTVPPCGFRLPHSHDDGRSLSISCSEQSLRDPLIDEQFSAQSAPPDLITKSLPSLVPSAALFLGIFVLHFSVNSVHTSSTDRRVIIVGRKLLQDHVQEDESNGIGTLFGWLMATIYMGGRLPQICLNIRRGNVQGLNPLMFMSALAGNATYVGSILVKSLEWSKIKPNLPWIVDAVGCVLLDAFILIQFVYYCRIHKSPKSQGNPVYGV